MGEQAKGWLQSSSSFSPCFCLCQISQHYSKPRVTPVEVMPVFPDFKVRSGTGGRGEQPAISAHLSLMPVPSIPQMWINPCAQVIFDSDPAPKDTSGAAALEMMSQAMIR